RHGAAGVRIVREALDHQERAQVGVAKPERPELVAALGDALRRVARQIDGDLLREEEDAAGVLVSFDVEDACLFVEKLEQVQAGEVAGRIVEKHELATRIGRVNSVRCLARVPLVDGVIELQTGISALPCRLCHVPPELPGRETLYYVACR